MINRELVIEQLKACKHKKGVNSADWDKVKPNLLILAKFTLEFTEKHKLPLTFTSIIRPKLKGSVSTTHEDGRAFDISIKGWSRANIDLFLELINGQFKIGAISLADKIEKEAIYHDIGLGAHIHVQCRK